jgi:putative oxidoreductase
MMVGAAEFWWVRKGFYFTKAGAELPVIWLALLCLQVLLGDGGLALVRSPNWRSINAQSKTAVGPSDSSAP